MSCRWRLSSPVLRSPPLPLEGSLEEGQAAETGEEQGKAPFLSLLPAPVVSHLQGSSVPRLSHHSKEVLATTSWTGGKKTDAKFTSFLSSFYIYIYIPDHIYFLLIIQRFPLTI